MDKKNKKLLDICTFWFGEYLRSVDRLCLMSMLKAGHKVRLYAYGEVKNLPDGIELCDASEILPYETLYRIDPSYPEGRPKITIVQFSDLFRTFLMEKEKGIWLDTDVYLVKPFHINPKEVWLAKENKQRVGVSALYYPKNTPIIDEFRNYLVSDKILPDWLGFKRRVLKPLRLRLKNLPITAANVGITVFGNDGVSRLAKKYGYFEKAKPKECFYYWTGRFAKKIFDPKYGLEPLEHPDFIGFHIHAKAHTQEKPKYGSFYHWAVQRIPEFKDYE